jgi:hypothetical protein
MPPTPLDERLPALHAHYTARVNAAIAAGRMDLVDDLANDCEDEALALILEADAESGGRSRGPVDVLEAGGWPGWRFRRLRTRWRRR